MEKNDPLPKILVVDDKPQNILSIKVIFEREPYDIVTANSGNEALSQVLQHEFALVLLDVQMPGMDGFEVAELLRSHKKTAHLPIIFMTAINKDQAHMFKGYQSGAVDYLFKPLNEQILKNKVGIFIDLYRQKKQIEEKNNELESANMQILEQQGTLVEEARMKVLLQMAGATAHELNNPLMVLLGNIELLKFHEDSPESIRGFLSEVETSGKRIADIVKRIQYIQTVKTKPYPGGGAIIDIPETIDILWVEDSDLCFNFYSKMLLKKRPARVFRAVSVEEACERLSERSYDLGICDFSLADGDGIEFLRIMKDKKRPMPIVMISGLCDEGLAEQCIQEGAHAFVNKADFNLQLFHRYIDSAMESFKNQSIPG